MDGLQRTHQVQVLGEALELRLHVRRSLRAGARRGLLQRAVRGLQPSHLRCQIRLPPGAARRLCLLLRMCQSPPSELLLSDTAGKTMHA
jgi:hypothetical protein